jgi:hypothetical protein
LHVILDKGVNQELLWEIRSGAAITTPRRRRVHLGLAHDGARLNCCVADAAANVDRVRAILRHRRHLGSRRILHPHPGPKSASHQASAAFNVLKSDLALTFTASRSVPICVTRSSVACASSSSRRRKNSMVNCMTQIYRTGIFRSRVAGTMRRAHQERESVVGT